MNSDLTYIINEVREYDYDRFLCCLFAGKEEREALLTLYAFNLEIAKLQEKISEPMAGYVRLQWWREAIEAMFAGNPPQHQVVQALVEVKEKFGISEKLCLRLIDSREFDFAESPPATMEVLEGYADNTSSPLLFLGLEVLEINNPNDEMKIMIRHLGTAWALTGILRAARFNVPKGRMYFPDEYTEGQGVSLDTYGSEKFHENARKVVEKITAKAAEHQKSAKELIEKLPRDLKRKLSPILLLSGLTESYIKRIKKSGHDVFAGEIEGGILSLQLKMFKNAALNRF